MTEYYIPTRAAESEFVEKRSRFIGYIKPVETEAEARAFVEKIKKRHYDARHNCWCYLLREGGVVRYSDDGEPQGTAGQPMLGVFEKEGITDLVCVVTRYFGGILLGTGGLLRAYTKGAKDALDAAGVSVVRRWVRQLVPCTYSLYERLKQETERFGAVIEDGVQRGHRAHRAGAGGAERRLCRPHSGFYRRNGGDTGGRRGISACAGAPRNTEIKERLC